MAGSYRKLKSGKWQLRYTDPTGKQVSGGTYPTKQLAQLANSRIENSMAMGTYELELAVTQGDLDPKTVTLSKLAAHWRNVRVGKDGQPLSERTLREYERIVEVVLIEFKDVPLRTITTQQLERWLADKRKTAPRMANAAYKHLNTLMTYALKYHYIKQNPCNIEGGTTYRPDSEPDVPSKKQVQILIDSAPEPFNVLVALAAASGLRRGELLELRRKDFSEFEEDGQQWIRVSVSRAVVQIEKHHIVKRPKSRAGIRTLTLPPQINDLVTSHFRNIPISPEALLFANDRAHLKHWNESFVRSQWERLRPIANYPGTFHSFRAYAATQFGLTGATNREIQDRFGHSDFKTANRYQRSTGRETQLLRSLVD